MIEENKSRFYRPPLADNAERSGRLLGLVGIPLILASIYLADVSEHGFHEANTSIYETVRDELKKSENAIFMVGY